MSDDEAYKQFLGTMEFETVLTSVRKYGSLKIDELVKDGLNIPVTLDILQHYIDLVLDSTFNESIRLQISAFKKGFNPLKICFGHQGL